MEGGDKFLLALGRTREQVNKCAFSVLEYIEDESLKAKYLNELEKVLVSCVESEHAVVLSKRAAKEAITKVKDEETGIPVTDRYDEAYQESLEMLEEDSNIEEIIANAPSVRAFREQILAQCGDSDEFESEELIATQQSVNIIDAISKKIIMDPVRNKHCGHVYDRSSVTDMIKVKRKKGFKCPYMGCGYRQPLKLSDLVDALDVKRQIILEQKRNSNR